MQEIKKVQVCALSLVAHSVTVVLYTARRLMTEGELVDSKRGNHKRWKLVFEGRAL